MATRTVPRRAPETFTFDPFPVWSFSTKGLNCDDSFAKLIGPDFVDLVDPRKLIMFLPPDLLTEADEEKVVARQDMMGRQEAAKLLLALMCVRGDWVPRLQQGLRHREIRLSHFADKIDALQSEVRMEIDFADNTVNDMEVDSEPWSHTTHTETHPPSPQEAPPPTQPLCFQSLASQDLTTPGFPVQAAQGPPPGQDLTAHAPPSQGPPSQAAAPQVGFPELPPRMAAGRSLEELSPVAGQRSGPGQRSDPHAVLSQIASHFFLNLAQSPQDVKLLTEQFERIASALTTTYAVGCLEMRLRVTTSRDLRQLRRLVESGVLQDTVTRVVLNKERREWLRAEAAKYGLAWRQIRLKVTIAKQDLDRCETFLRIREERPNPRNAADALLQKSGRLGSRIQAVMSEEEILAVPDLLLSFIQWTHHHHPDLAQQLAQQLDENLAKQKIHLDARLEAQRLAKHLHKQRQVQHEATRLTISLLHGAIVDIMATCCHHFALEERLHEHLGHVAFDMLYSVEREEAASEATFPQAQDEEGPLEHPSLCITAPPESPLADVVQKLMEAKLMTPRKVSNTEHTFRFVDVFVADFALACIVSYVETVPDDYVFRVLQVGSPFVVLPLFDMCWFKSFSSDLEESQYGRVRPKRLTSGNAIADQLLQSMSDPSCPQAVTDLYFACSILGHQEDTALFKRCWWTFGQALKRRLREMLGSVDPISLPDILLCPLSNGEMNALRETGQQVLSARHTVDLTDKLTTMSRPQIRVVLACAQLTNVASFHLVKVGNVAAVKLDLGISAATTSSTGQPALKLCKNHLEDRHVECLLDAMPGLESVSRWDLSFCSITQSNLQRLLDRLSMSSVKTLILNGISFSDSPNPSLPKFSHLRRLQAVDLGGLRLQDSDMPHLSQQIHELLDLRELTLESNTISTESLSQLTPALAANTSLRALRLPGCQLDAGGAFVLGAMLTSAVSLHVLNFSHCPLTDSGLLHLSQVLRKHTALNKVSLREGGYSPPGLASFFFYIKTCNRLQFLELGQCPLEEEGFDVSDQFLQVLAGSCHWDFLGLWRCRVGHTSLLQQLGTLPTQLRGLTSLVLQDNDIGDAQLGHLAQAMQAGVFRHLKHLNLGQNTFGEAGAKRLAEELCFLPHMSELLIQHSSVPVDGAFCLARAILHLPEMTLLDLSDSYGMGRNDVSDAITKIERLVQDEGILIGCGVGYTDSDSAVEDLSVAHQLRLLDLQDIQSADKEEESIDQGKEKKLAPKSSDAEHDIFIHGSDIRLIQPVPAEDPEEVYDDCDIPVRAVLPAPHEFDIHVSGAVDLISPGPEETTSRGREERRREISGRERDTLFFDDKLRISLGHQ